MSYPRVSFGLVFTKGFEKDIKRMARRGRDLAKLWQAIELLKSGRELPKQYHNHALQGDLAGREECHVAPDWLLIYRKRKDVLVLIMLRTGTHADLFGK